MNIITIKELDHILDYVPVISTVSNLIDITAKIVFGNFSKEPINNFPYFAHLSEKSYVRCITLLIPIIGNVIVALYDTIGNSPISLEDNALHPSSVNKIEIHKNPLTTTITTSRPLSRKNILDLNSSEKKIDVVRSKSKSKFEKEIDIKQQDIIANYEEFKNQRPNIATTNAVNPSVFIQPVGIKNTSKNCWCISVLQVLCNTPLYEYVMSSDSTLQEQFPKLFGFIKTYKEKPESSEQLGSKIKEIREELNKRLGKQFSLSEDEEGDAMGFIMQLFEYLNLDYSLTGYLETRNEKIKDLLITQKEQCIFINPERILKADLDIEDIFDSTPYEPIAVIRAEPAHYSCQVKGQDGVWYQCNDDKVSKKLRVFQSASVENDHGILIVGYRKTS